MSRIQSNKIILSSSSSFLKRLKFELPSESSLAAISCMVYFTYFHPSLNFPLVCSIQSAAYSRHFTLTDIYKIISPPNRRAWSSDTYLQACIKVLIQSHKVE